MGPGGRLLVAAGRGRGRDIVLGEGRTRSPQEQQLGLSSLPRIYIHPGLDLESLSHGVEKEGGGWRKGGREVESVWEWRRGRETGCSPKKNIPGYPSPRHLFAPSSQLDSSRKFLRFAPYSKVGN